MVAAKNLNLGYYTPSVDSAGWLMWEVTHLWKRKIEERLEKYDLTNYQLMLLRALLQLSEKGHVVNQADLANYLHSNVMMTSNVLRTLEKKKLIQRNSHSTDTRAKILVLTPAGIELANKGLVEILAVNEEIFGKDKQLSQDIIRNLKQLLKLNY